jgi:predicted ATPase/signal transduction histidine kinase
LHEGENTFVYRARARATHHSVIVKLPAPGASGRQLTRYRNEYELLSSLELDGVIKAHGLLKHDGRLALVLEDFGAESLQQWLMRRQVRLDEAIWIAIDLAAIVGEVHAANIIHKDINPQNILIHAGTGKLKLIDFGIATRLQSEGGDFEHPGALEGTLAYIAPEQTGRMNRRLDYRADFYSLGATLYALFTGSPPHRSQDPLDMIHFHIAGKITPPCEVNPQLPVAVSDIVLKLLAKAPEDRYQSAAGLAADLQTCLDRLRAGRPIEPFGLGAHDLIERFELPQKLYGRESELAALLAAFDRVAQARVETLLIAGRAGVGKSALVNELHEHVSHKRGFFLSAKFDQLQRDIPFSALVAALQQLVQQLLTQSEAMLGRWRDAIRAAVGPNGQVIVDVIPSLELIIGAQPPVPQLDPTESRNRFNLVFQEFLQVFCRAAHPVVLFLDDMQWADSASLNLLTLILAGNAAESLLVIQAYRDDETPDGHAFLRAVWAQKQRGVTVGSIELNPLSNEHTARFVADVVREDAARAAALADAVWHKTAGNPFFIRQFLQTLYAEKLLWFDAKARAFRYDIEAIRAAAITENVAQLLAQKIERLPPATQQALRVAAAIGNHFDLDMLATVHASPPGEIAENLREAIQDGLIHPTSRLESLDPEALDSPLVYRRYAFLHARVQQSAYATLAKEEREALHLKIGRVLLDNTASADLDARIFDVVNHLNQGAALIDSPREIERLIELNLRAGTKARNSTGYALAVRSFRTAAVLLARLTRSDVAGLAYEVHTRLAESLWLCADFAAAFEAVEQAAGHARSGAERARLNTIRINSYLSQGDMHEAVAAGVQACRELGLALPQDPAQIGRQLQEAIGVILDRCAQLPIESLLELPVMSDPDKIALMSLLKCLLPPAYQTNQQLFALITCKMVTLSLASGNCPLSANGYGSFAPILSGMLGRYEDAYRFGKLGVDLSKRFDDISVRPGAYFVWAAFASAWVKPIAESLELFATGVADGLNGGDHPHAAYCAARSLTHLQFTGTPLAEFRAEADKAVRLLHRLGDLTNLVLIEPRIRLAQCLETSMDAAGSMNGDRFDEEHWIADGEKQGSRSILGDLHITRLRYRYLCGNFEAAYRIAQESEALLPYNVGFTNVAEHNFYYSLTLAALALAADPTQRAAYLATLEANQRQLQAWAGTCPANFAHMHALVEAERARLLGLEREARDGYDRAIAAAADAGFTHIEALACERAVEFWLAQAKADFAGLYLERALRAYEAWGATAKVRQLRERYAFARQERVALARWSGGERGTISDALDLAAVVKAVQAISGEIVIERLLSTLMDIILENAGAEAGSLILASGDTFLVQASKDLDTGTTVMQSIPLERAARLSEGIVRLVLRTKQHVVLDDAAQRKEFASDAYVQSVQPKSVLCAPILRTGTLLGALYLENNLVAGAFTPDRLRALNILVSQVAVSIENATLYARQQQQAQELSRYKDHLEELVAERTRELQEAQGRLLDLSRRAGMAEVASGVLHNVGNVMNSVNVGASVAREAVSRLPIDSLARICDMLDGHAQDLGAFLTADAKGRKIPEYLRRLAQNLEEFKRRTLQHLDDLSKHLEHMKVVISAQQTYAKTGALVETCSVEEAVESAIEINALALTAACVQVERDFAELPPALIDRHQVIQILVNLVSNAVHALEVRAPHERRLHLRIRRSDRQEIAIEVRDNGVGIPREVLGRIFQHGFTTRKNGHGFGLHNSANAAQQMKGRLTAHSDGPDQGARFVLQLPVQFVEENVPHYS